MSIGDEIMNLANRSKAKENPGDYVVGGLLHCGVCGEAKQCQVLLMGKLMKVGCMCKCQRDEYEAEELKKKADQQRLKVQRLREAGIADPLLAKCRFELAERSPELERCWKYVLNWPEAVRDNKGLLLWGGVGNGKTYAAACIANALIDRGVAAVVTSFPRLLGLSFEDRDRMLNELRKVPLLVIDDLGTERSSDFAMETVYRVIDERYKVSLPLIVTTNLTLDEMHNPKNLDYKRIYDRVLEMCTPYVFMGESRREKIAKQKMAEMREMLK